MSRLGLQIESWNNLVEFVETNVLVMVQLDKQIIECGKCRPCHEYLMNIQSTRLGRGSDWSFGVKFSLDLSGAGETLLLWGESIIIDRKSHAYLHSYNHLVLAGAVLWGYFGGTRAH